MKADWLRILNGNDHQDYTSITKDTGFRPGFAFLGINIHRVKYYTVGNIAEIHYIDDKPLLFTNYIIDNRPNVVMVLTPNYDKNTLEIAYKNSGELETDITKHPDKFTEEQIQHFREIIKDENGSIVGEKALIERSEIPYKSPVSPYFIGMNETAIRELFITKVINNTPREVIDKIVEDLTKEKVRKCQ